jgi:hypothetical protein
LGVQLCLRNVTRETLIVDGFALSRAGLVAVAQANDLLSTVKSIAHAWYEHADKGVFAILRPDELRQFPLHLLDGLQNADNGDVLTISCAWRNTRRYLPWSRRVKIKTSVGDIRALDRAGQQSRYVDDGEASVDIQGGRS